MGNRYLRVYCETLKQETISQIVQVGEITYQGENTIKYFFFAYWNESETIFDIWL